MGRVYAFLHSDFSASLIALAIAFVLGTLIGAERQYRQRTAGLRTNVLVALGAAAFSDMGMRLIGTHGAVQIISYVVSGVGFLGAGVIMKEGTNIRGLNTAATLWCSAAVGAFSGVGLPAEAVMLAAFVLAGNTLLRPLVNMINRRPIDERTTEARYQIHITTTVELIDTARDYAVDEIERANYPIRSIEVIERGEGEMEAVITLVTTAVEPGEIEAIVATLGNHPSIQHASWTVSTTD